MRYKIASISHIFKPTVICVICQHPHSQAFAVCNACRQLFMPIGPACRHCAQPLPDATFAVCGACCQKQPMLDHVFAAYQFEEPLRTLLHEFKYREGLYLTPFLAHLILKSLPNELTKTQCLIPVPLHQDRLQERGFNQAAELAKHLSHKINKPYQLSLCKKIKKTLPQAGLTAEQRKKNLNQAFQAMATCYQHVTLIDDLMTTGSTVNELARTLKNTGIKRVDVWCCARAVVQKFY